MSNKKKLLLALIIILGFAGFLDSTYLTILHYKNAFPPCLLYHECATVLTSKYSTIGSLPVSLLGSAYYLLVIIVSILIIQNPTLSLRAKRSSLANNSRKKEIASGYLNPRNDNPFLILAVVSGIGFLVSFYFFLIQAFVLSAYCQYCLASETISLLILILSFKLVRLNKNR